MPARNKAASGKKTTGRQKRAVRKATAKTTGGSRASRAEIAAKTPAPRKATATRQPTEGKKAEARKKTSKSASSGQRTAARKRDAAPAPRKAVKQTTGGAQAKSTRR